MKKKSPKKGKRLPLPKKAGRPIGTRRGGRGYARRDSKDEEREILLQAKENAHEWLSGEPDARNGGVLYEAIDHTADLGMKVQGQDLPQLFEKAARALFHLLAEPSGVSSGESLSLSLNAEDVELLFVEWLRELLYLSSAKHWLFSRFEIAHVDENSLQATCWGEHYNPARHSLRTEIKAVTYHELSVRQTPSGWEAHVIFDI